MHTAILFADAHAGPAQSLKRFEALGNCIVEVKPDFVACLGDLGTCDSVSTYPVKYEDTTTLREDADTIIAAQEALFKPLNDYNSKRRRSRHKRHYPLKILTKGNHEERLDRQVMADETGLGSVVEPNELFQFHHYWDIVREYKEYYSFLGLLFTHAPTNAMGQPISGVTRGRQTCFQTDKPVFYGHTHSFDHTTMGIMGNGNKVRSSVNLPCFMDQDHVEEYAQGSTTGWCYGFLILKIFAPGQFSYEWVSMPELYDKFL